MSKSLLDLAYEYVSKNKQQSKFQDIWSYCVKEAGLNEQQAEARISRFYTNLMLDGRFVTLGENEWDLRERHPFEKVHIDMSEVYSNIEVSYDDAEEVEEEEEYNKALMEDKEENDDDDSLSNNDDEKNDHDDDYEF